MKNIFLTLFVLLISINAFAKDRDFNFKNSKSIKKDKLARVCCKSTYSNSDGEFVSVTQCVPSTGDQAGDFASACEKASKLAKQVLTNMN